MCSAVQLMLSDGYKGLESEKYDSPFSSSVLDYEVDPDRKVFEYKIEILGVNC
jgi:hypothetical protein